MIPDGEAGPKDPSSSLLVLLRDSCWETTSHTTQRSQYKWVTKWHSADARTTKDRISISKQDSNSGRTFLGPKVSSVVVEKRQTLQGPRIDPQTYTLSFLALKENFLIGPALLWGFDLNTTIYQLCNVLWVFYLWHIYSFICISFV